jgi:hypothetical protein
MRQLNSVFFTLSLAWDMVNSPQNVYDIYIYIYILFFLPVYIFSLANLLT